MLYESFTTIRGLLKPIPGLKGVQWYNVQYEGTIYVSPVAFIEFPERIPLGQITGDSVRADFVLRIHIVSAVTASQDGSIQDRLIMTHETLAKKAFKQLEGKQIPLGEGKSTSLIPSGWQHYHKYKGWMVTFIDFKASGIAVV